MSTYLLIIEKENIKILKKKNTFKIEINFDVDTDCDIIEKFDNDEIFKIIKALNKDIIEYININKKDNSTSDITIVLNNFEFNEDYDNDDEKYYLSFTKNIESKENNFIIINGNKNSIELAKDKYKKLQIENIHINLTINQKKLILIIKIKYDELLLPIYLENFVAKLFGKLFLKLIKYYVINNK